MSQQSFAREEGPQGATGELEGEAALLNQREEHNQGAYDHQHDQREASSPQKQHTRLELERAQKHLRQFRALQEEVLQLVDHMDETDIHQEESLQANLQGRGRRNEETRSKPAHGDTNHGYQQDDYPSLQAYSECQTKAKVELMGTPPTRSSLRLSTGPDFAPPRRIPGMMPAFGPGGPALQATRACFRPAQFGAQPTSRPLSPRRPLSTPHDQGIFPPEDGVEHPPGRTYTVPTSPHHRQLGGPYQLNNGPQEDRHHNPGVHEAAAGGNPPGSYSATATPGTYDTVNGVVSAQNAALASLATTIGPLLARQAGSTAEIQAVHGFMKGVQKLTAENHGILRRAAEQTEQELYIPLLHPVHPDPGYMGTQAIPSLRECFIPFFRGGDHQGPAEAATFISDVLRWGKLKNLTHRATVELFLRHSQGAAKDTINYALRRSPCNLEAVVRALETEFLELTDAQTAQEQIGLLNRLPGESLTKLRDRLCFKARLACRHEKEDLRIQKEEELVMVNFLRNLSPAVRSKLEDSSRTRRMCGLAPFSVLELSIEARTIEQQLTVETGQNYTGPEGTFGPSPPSKAYSPHLHPDAIHDQRATLSTPSVLNSKKNSTSITTTTRSPDHQGPSNQIENANFTT